jgi:glucose-1-phosphate adenylyltransferase
MVHAKVLTMIMAGGRGSRLFPLTFERSKPSVPFGGRYRIVDFVLSNFINSEMFSIYLLVQYKSQSLIEHIRENWGLSSIMPDHFVTIVPPQMRFGPDWFQGTANAVFQNLNLIRQQKPDFVAVFGADHIYRMDIRQMLKFHIANNADVTVAARPVHVSEGKEFGIIAADINGKMTGFEEKPENPTPIVGSTDMALCSMGNYIFNTDVLINALIESQRREENDFGKHVIPRLLENGKNLYTYDFAGNIIPGVKPYEEKGYWRDVGNIESFWQSHQDMLGKEPLFEMQNDQWSIKPSRNDLPAARILGGNISNSIISEGTIIKNAKIVNSFIRKGTIIEDGAEVTDSIIMDQVVIKKGAKLNKVIVDSYNVIEEDVQIGTDSTTPYWRAYSDPSGITVIASEKFTGKL